MPADRRRHEAEIRQHRVAAADPGVAVEDVPEAVLLGDLLHVRAGVGHRDELRSPALSVAHRVAASRSKKYAFRMFGSSVPPDLLETTNERVREVEALLEGGDLLRVGAVEHQEFGEAAAMAECLAQHFRPEARSAHAQQQHVLEAAGADLLLECLEIGQRL